MGEFLRTLVKDCITLYTLVSQIANRFNEREASRFLLLWAGLNEVSDTTGCGLAQEQPRLIERKYRLRAQCRRNVKECRLAEWLTDHYTTLESAASHLRACGEPALVKIGELLDEFLPQPEIARGRNCTWYLGDLIVALECPPNAALYTTNSRHFEALCAQLDKQVYEP